MYYMYCKKKPVIDNNSNSGFMMSQQYQQTMIEERALKR